jgi:hypothetical protein
MVADSEKLAEVHRLLDRYVVEIVEAYGFCPWARAARTGGEIAVAVLWGEPGVPQWKAAASELLARPATRVAMVVAPELAADPQAFRAVREAVAREVAHAGVAEFHPDASYDDRTPPRLVPFVRRSPDPLLQFVPLELLAGVRAATTTPLSEQAMMLGGVAQHSTGDVGDRIAETNHARVLAERAAIEAVLDDIAADRRRRYPRVGIAIHTSR